MMTFKEWFSQRDWWHENSRREDFERFWDALIARGFPPEDAGSLLDQVIDSVADEYGA